MSYVVNFVVHSHNAESDFQPRFGVDYRPILFRLRNGKFGAITRMSVPISQSNSPARKDPVTGIKNQASSGQAISDCKGASISP